MRVAMQAAWHPLSAASSDDTALQALVQWIRDSGGEVSAFIPSGCVTKVNETMACDGLVQLVTACPEQSAVPNMLAPPRDAIALHTSTAFTAQL